MDLSETLGRHELDRMREVVRHPDWYHELGKVHKVRSLGLGAVQAALGGSITEAGKQVKENLVTMFEQLLAEEVVALGGPDQNLEDWDGERQPVDTIVIHHTSREPGLTTKRLNALHLLRLYVPRYQSETSPVLTSDGTSQPIYSGHFDENGNQVFFAYHWMVRHNGDTERLLDDSLTGWHAGDWDVNCRSVAICIDDDLSSKRPSHEAMDSITEIITREYPEIHISPTSLLGHREIYSKTICPGSEFVDGWKIELLDRLSA